MIQAALFLLRIASAEDESAVSDLLAATYPVLMGSAYPEEVLAAALPAMTRANPDLLTSGTYYVVELAGGVVGCGGWTKERPGTGEITPGLAHIRHFATDPGHCRRGIGRLIYSACESSARAAGINQFECNASLNGVAFYSALGFKPVQRICVSPGPGIDFPSLLMLRSIVRQI